MSDLDSGKGHKDENFPVASWLIKRAYRAPVLTFYTFARAADDIADHASAPEAEKLSRLAEMRAGLEGQGAPEAMALAEAAKARGLDLVHAHELLDAFTLDVTKRRYADWADLMAYCRLSAMPVGRMVLDVHGEDRAIWAMSDALCAALQVINHLQDCGKDYRAIDRVYIPEPMLAAQGIGVSALGEGKASPQLLAVIRDLARQTQGLLRESAPFARHIRDARLSAEVAVIQRLAEDLTLGLLARDPLEDKVHHSRPRMALLAMGAVLRNLFAGKAA
ncbi:MAG: squalene synthase HpnC [Novosphingobium sp.]